MGDRLQRWLISAAALGLLGFPAVGASGGHSPEGRGQGERRIVVFYTAEVHGAVEPCGCTSDPLGDVSRFAWVIAEARKSGAGVALVDAGSLLYPEAGLSAKERPSADLRGEFLAEEFTRMGLLGSALGETDLARGAEHVRPPRLASNLSNVARGLRPPRVDKVGGVAIGVLGLADPGLATPLGANASDMIDSARRDVASLRRSGAEILILLAPVDKNLARRLAREAGADIVVLGKGVGSGMRLPERIGRTFLVSPADELQKVGRLEIVLRSPAQAGAPLDLQDAGGPDAVAARREEVSRALERLRASLAKWSETSSPTSAGRSEGGGSQGNDRAFVAEKQREAAELEAEQRRLEVAWVPPARGDYLVNELVPLRRSVRRDPTVAAAMKKLDQRIATMNLKAATPPPPGEPGRATYVGIAKCAGCHASATAFWKHTAHAHAWNTLVRDGKQADYKCVGCHVAGFGQVGGSALGFTRQLESVQCENCHGPGSLHVAGQGAEAPLAIKRDVPETVCVGCHTEQHSDTFQLEAYLRDIVGPGHGRSRREQLGAGPSGQALRRAALAKAKLAAARDRKSDAGAPKANLKKM